MPGIQSKTTGLYTALFGGAVIGASYMADIKLEWLNAVGFVIIIIGLAIFIGGLAQSLVYQARAEKGVHSDDTAVVATVLIRCMLAISVADGHLADKEIRTVIKIYEKLTGSLMPEDTVREVSSAMQAEGTNLSAELANTKNVLGKDLKDKIVLAALYILAADGVVEAAEAQTLEQIREGLGVPRGKFNSIKSAFLEERNLG